MMSIGKQLSEDWKFEDRYPTEKCDVLDEHIYYEIITALGIPACDTTDYSAWEHVNFSRLGHCRVLIEFFSGSRKKDSGKIKPDDVLSEDYGYGPEVFKFTAGGEDRLNKDLFHLTYARLRHKKDLQNKPWPDEYLVQMHITCIEFVKHLLRGSLPKGITLREPLRWEKLLSVLESGREVRISYPAGMWRVEEGAVLPNRYSTFTRCPTTRAAGGAMPVILRSNEANSSVTVVQLTVPKSPKK